MAPQPHPKAFIFSKMMPELNAVVFYGKAGRHLITNYPATIGDESVDVNNCEEFVVEEVKPMLFKVTTPHGRPYMIGSDRLPKIRTNHTYESQCDQLTVVDEVVMGKRRGQSKIFVKGNKKVVVKKPQFSTTFEVRGYEMTGNISKLVLEQHYPWCDDAFRDAAQFLGSPIYTDWMLYTGNRENSNNQ